MIDESETPIEIEHVEVSPLGREKIVMRLSGRWRGRRRSQDARAFLVVEADGRRHRFPAIPEPRRSRIGRPGTWAASIALPAWLEPQIGGQTSLWIGNSAIPLPPRGDAEAVPGGEPLRAPVPEATPDAVLEAVPEPPDPPDDLRVPAGDDETVAALRAELERRAASEAQLRGMLADARADLGVRGNSRAELEATHAELRAELDQLLALIEEESAKRAEVESRAMILAAELADLQASVAELISSRDAVAEQNAELRAGLAESAVGRDAASSEAAGLRAELDRLGAELADARGHREAADAGLGEARALLGEARAVTARLRERGLAD